MKTKHFISFLLSIFIMSSFLISSYAQEKKIDKKDLPAKVLAAFQKSYPKAEIKGASTEKEHGKTYYEIESMDGTQARDLLYTKDGKVAEIEEAYAADNIPDFITKSIMKEYPNSKIHKVEKLTKGNKISYEAVVEHNDKKSEIVLDSKGNIKKMEKKNEEKEGKESKEENEEDDKD